VLDLLPQGASHSPKAPVGGEAHRLQIVLQLLELGVDDRARFVSVHASHSPVGPGHSLGSLRSPDGCPTTIHATTLRQRVDRTA